MQLIISIVDLTSSMHLVFCKHIIFSCFNTPLSYRKVFATQHEVKMQEHEENSYGLKMGL